MITKGCVHQLFTQAGYSKSPALDRLVEVILKGSDTLKVLNGCVASGTRVIQPQIETSVTDVDDCGTQRVTISFLVGTPPSL